MIYLVLEEVFYQSVTILDTDIGVYREFHERLREMVKAVGRGMKALGKEWGDLGKCGDVQGTETEGRTAEASRLPYIL